MLTAKVRIVAATVGGIGIGLALGFGLAFAWAETRLVDGVARRVVRFVAHEDPPGVWGFPTDLVRHRVVGNVAHGDLLLECDAFHMGSRLGLLYALEGAIAGLAVGFGADARKVVAAGLMGTVVFSVFYLIAATMMPWLDSPAAAFSFVAMIVLLALLVACGEAGYSASGTKPE
ncbi:MAG: hypothetical protein HY289_04390 [Planctomycetes bacterium]|nr:hypothetical protein [Planctomycetota bacterium]